MPAVRARQSHAAEVGQLKLELLVGRPGERVPASGSQPYVGNEDSLSVHLRLWATLRGRPDLVEVRAGLQVVALEGAAPLVSSFAPAPRWRVDPQDAEGFRILSDDGCDGTCALGRWTVVPAYPGQPLRFSVAGDSLGGPVTGRDAAGASMEAREIVKAAANTEVPPPAIYPTWAFEPAAGRIPAATDYNASDYARVLGRTIPGYLQVLRSGRSSALVEVSADGIPGDSLPLQGGLSPRRCVELLSGARYLHWTIAYRDDPYAFRFDISASRTDSLGRIGSVLSSPMRPELIAARHRGRDSFLYCSNGARVPLLSHAISAQFLEDGVYALGVSGMTQGRDGSGSVRLDRWAWDGTPLEFVDLDCFGKIAAVRWGQEGEVAVLVRSPDRAGTELIVRSTQGEIRRRSYPRSEESVYLGDVSGGEVLLRRGRDRCEVLATENMEARTSWVHPWASFGLPPGTLESNRLRFLRDGRVVCVAWAQIETPSGGRRSETRVSVVGRDGKVVAALEGWPTDLRRRRGERLSPSIQVDVLGSGAVLVSAPGEGAAVYEIPEPE